MMGKYSVVDIPAIRGFIDEMTMSEKNDVVTMPFNKLWAKLWGVDIANIKSANVKTQSKKFNILKTGVRLQDGVVITLAEIVHDSKTSWTCPEWEFPKGRRNSNEGQYACAVREFEEETGISKKHLNVIENIVPFNEIFTGSNGVIYSYKYFLAHISDSSDMCLDNFQSCEISNMCWKTADECLISTRPYNLEKIRLIHNISNILENYTYL